MGFFTDRLQAFPRYELYQLGVETGLYPYYRSVESASRPRVTVEGREVINFGSNNYLSLSYHPRVIDAAVTATRRFGTGVTGSRLLNGTLTLHRELEGELADFYGVPSCLVFSTGYVANASAIAGFLGRHDVAIVDKEAHNSLLSGVRLSGATMRRFRHNDVAHLEKVLASAPAEVGKGVIVDGVYSMGGDTAPLAEMVEVCRRYPNTFLLDDEAHGLGVLGDRGRGALEQQQVLHDVDLVTVTFSKSLGSCGGALLGPADAIELLTVSSDLFIFTASNTPGSVAAALEALRILREEPERPARLRANVDLFIGLLAERGVPTNPAESAIVTIPLRRADDASVAEVFRDLFEGGVFVNPVISPAVTSEAGLIRLSLMVEHDAAMLEEASELLFKVLAEHDQFIDPLPPGRVPDR